MIRLLLLFTIAFALVQVGWTQLRDKRVTPITDEEARRFDSSRKAGVAILVGVGQYPAFGGLGGLRYATRDVDALGSELEAQHYSVVKLKDSEAFGRAILRAISQAGELLDPQNGNLIFFFSGHGFAESGANYLASFDASADDLSHTGVSIKAIEEAMERTGAQRRIMWLDACRNDANSKDVGGARSFKAFSDSSGTRILFSTKAGHISYEDDRLQHGLFTYFLLKGLQGEAGKDDGFISFRDLADFVADRVGSRSLQLGHVQVPYEAGESSGDFLIGRAALNQPPLSALPIQPAVQQPSGGPSEEQKERTETQARKNADLMEKNRVLNDTYNSALAFIKTAEADSDDTKRVADYALAIDSLEKASHLDSRQVAIWNQMGIAYRGIGRVQSGDEQKRSYDAAIEAFKKSLAIKEEASVYNEMGNLYAAEKMLAEASDSLSRAAQLDPAMAPQAYFNLGANLVNGGQPAKAVEYFKKATDADPSYAEAWYQYGALRVMQGKVNSITGQTIYPPDTASALETYLSLQPKGSHANQALAMLRAMGVKTER